MMPCPPTLPPSSVGIMGAGGKASLNRVPKTTALGTALPIPGGERLDVRRHSRVDRTVVDCVVHPGSPSQVSSENLHSVAQVALNREPTSPGPEQGGQPREPEQDARQPRVPEQGARSAIWYNLLGCENDPEQGSLRAAQRLDPEQGELQQALGVGGTARPPNLAELFQALNRQQCGAAKQRPPCCLLLNTCL